MIKKITTEYPDFDDLKYKINEIVELLNAITIDVDGTKCVDGSKAPTDPYAEQRRWIGCLCRFRQGFGAITTYGVLTEISPDSDLPYYKKDTDTYWKYCEPVKPDDDIIYKGGDNE